MIGSFVQLDLTHYSRAELKASDHRPVYAIIKAQVRVVDRAKKEAIRREVMQSVQVKKVQSQILAPIKNRELDRVVFCTYILRRGF